MQDEEPCDEEVPERFCTDHYTLHALVVDVKRSKKNKRDLIRVNDKILIHTRRRYDGNLDHDGNNVCLFPGASHPPPISIGWCGNVYLNKTIGGEADDEFSIAADGESFEQLDANDRFTASICSSRVRCQDQYSWYRACDDCSSANGFLPTCKVQDWFFDSFGACVEQVDQLVGCWVRKECDNTKYNPIKAHTLSPTWTPFEFDNIGYDDYSCQAFRFESWCPSMEYCLPCRD